MDMAAPVVNGRHDTVKKIVRVLCGVPLTLALLAGINTAAHAEVGRDPFAGGTWHAVKGSWPGTMVFDAKTKSMVLEPVGSAQMKGTYTYKLVKQAKPTKGVVDGTLVMTLATGQSSEAMFHIEKGTQLELIYATDGQSEHYQLMTAKEEAAATKKLEDHLKSSEGKAAVQKIDKVLNKGPR